ncbi:hypothetical protein ECK5_5280 [Escherichia coli O10:K5(L):H4 str. ATCC 23506]|uniref:Uncharacterized protein n=1 Tax=Escherichia coli ISC7 TaxID=1432555 RepID=W1F111_ECOLX|nr:hypothetical protein ECK5_5280 [Escherichia coli O10:K5(L):H4 str. ATCC 23506]CDL28031.1 hypothetical protein [Escherichia coli ISC7]
MPTKAELQVRVDELKKRTRASKKCCRGRKGNYQANYCQKNCHQQIY